VVLSLPLYVIGMKLMGIDGVALACALSATMQVAVLYLVWNRKRGNRGSRDVYRAIVKMLGVSILLGGGAFFIKAGLLSVVDNATFTGCIVILSITGGLSLFLFVAAGYFLRIEEITAVLNKLVRRLSRN
jgi:peptidoglycan biosynthesis protein MviN/MurJ (putative lipid II flippase)